MGDIFISFLSDYKIFSKCNKRLLTIAISSRIIREIIYKSYLLSWEKESIALITTGNYQYGKMVENASRAASQK